MTSVEFASWRKNQFSLTVRQKKKSVFEFSSSLSAHASSALSGRSRDRITRRRGRVCRGRESHISRDLLRERKQSAAVRQGASRRGSQGRRRALTLPCRPQRRGRAVLMENAMPGTSLGHVVPGRAAVDDDFHSPLAGRLS